MDYSRHYRTLIDRARARVLVCYSERHHIVPRCMGGSDEESNIVSLTPDEHFVAHLLLLKLHPHNRKIAFAAMMMRVGRGLTLRMFGNKDYGWVRRRVSAAMQGHDVSQETREKIRRALLGRKISEDRKAKVSSFHKGRKRSDATIGKLRLANIGKRHSDETISKLRLVSGRVLTEEEKSAKRAYRHTKEARLKISSAGFGRKHSEESRSKMRGRKVSNETKAKMRLAAARRENVRREKRGAVNVN